MRNDHERVTPATVTTSTSVSGARPPWVVCAAERGGEWRWVEPLMRHHGLRWSFAFADDATWLERLVPRPNLRHLRAALRAVREARRGADVIVAHEPRVAFCTALALRALGMRTPVLAHTFNFTRLPHRVLPRDWLRAIYREGFRTVDRFVVASTSEVDLYHDHFGIPRDRFDVVLWGLDAEDIQLGAPITEGDYVCSIGGNARDYPTLVEAMRRLPRIRFVLVVRPDSLDTRDLPPNVEVHTNLPVDQTMRVLAGSRFLVLPLEHEEVACGHVTMSSCMHLGRPFVVTDTAGIRDYARHEDNALLVPVGDAPALAAAISRLWDDHGLQDRLAEAGRAFAARACSSRHIVEHFERYLERKGVELRGHDRERTEGEARAA